MSDILAHVLLSVTSHLYSYLVEFELKAQDVAKGEWLTHVGLD